MLDPYDTHDEFNDLFGELHKARKLLVEIHDLIVKVPYSAFTIVENIQRYFADSDVDMTDYEEESV